jgi:hypothetical protein
MRNRAWRRHMSEKHTKRRLKEKNNIIFSFRNANDVLYLWNGARYIELLNTYFYYIAKGCVSTTQDSRYKQKYSRNNCRNSYAWKGDSNTRVEKRNELRKILKENGFRRGNTTGL